MDNQKVAKMETGSLNQVVTRKKQLWDNSDKGRWGYWNVWQQYNEDTDI